MSQYINIYEYDTEDWWRKEAQFCVEDGYPKAAIAAARLAFEAFVRSLEGEGEREPASLAGPL